MSSGPLVYPGEEVVDEDRYAVGDTDDFENVPPHRRQKSGRMEDEVNGLVELNDPCCPFTDQTAGIQLMEIRMTP